MAKKHRFDYFDAFVRQCEFACKESQALVDLMEGFRPGDEQWLKEQLEHMHAIEHEADDLNHEINNVLAGEFMPPIDREDISNLSQLLDDVTDSIEEVVQHLYMYNLSELHPGAIKMARIVDESADALLEAMKAFREFKKPKKLERLLESVQSKESEGDGVYVESKRDLFTARRDAPAWYLIAWNSMFSHMEECCDACEHVASVVKTITIKNT